MTVIRLNLILPLFSSSPARLSLHTRANGELHRKFSFCSPVQISFTEAVCRIHQFVTLRKLPVVSDLRTAQDLETFKATGDIAFVAFLESEDNEFAADLSRVLVKYRGEFPFGIVTDRSIAESQDVKIPAIVCYRSIDGEKLVTSEFESEKLNEWVKESSRQVLGDLTVLNQQRLLDVSQLQRHPWSSCLLTFW